MFLHGPAKGVCDVVGEEQAEAAIFDLDGYGGERLWHTFRERFHGPAVVMSVTEKHLRNAFWVRKPISVDDFLAAIELIQKRLKCDRFLDEIDRTPKWAAPPVTVRHPMPVSPVLVPLMSMATMSVATASVPTASVPTEPIPTASVPTVFVPTPVMPVPAENCQPAARRPCDRVTAKPCGDANGASRAAGLAWAEEQVHEACGSVDDAVYLDPKRRGELYYEPEEYLQEVLQRACQRAMDTSHPVSLDVLGQTMIVLAGGRQVICDTRQQQLRPLCVTPTGRLATLHDLREDELPKMQPQDPRLQSSESMLWLLSLWASRGRVPKGIDLDAPVSLLSWPSFSRLLIPPHGMQIAALWSTRPRSLMETAKLLAIPHRYVFALYSACLTLGLIERTPAAATQSDDTAVPAAKRGLLGSLLRKLRLAR